MKKRIFAVCDLESSYACNLMDYLNEKKTTPFEVQAFTNIESLAVFARKHEIEILLISTRAMCEEIKELPVNRTVILSEGETFQKFEEYPFVYKYQSSDTLLAEVMDYYAEGRTAPYMAPLKSEKTKLYGVYSPVSRSKRTLFALTLGEVLAEKNQVLYLNFEEYAGFEELFEKRYRTDLSDLIYFARQKEGNLIYKLNSVIQSFDNLQYIPPVLAPTDIRDVTGEEWIEFLGEIIANCEFEIVILDLTDQVDELYQIMNLCEKIYMPVLDDPVSRAKLMQYEKLIGMLDHNDLIQKTVKIKIPSQKINFEQGQLTRQLADGELGDYVRELLN